MDDAFFVVGLQEALVPLKCECSGQLCQRIVFNTKTAHAERICILVGQDGLEPSTTDL